MKENTQAKTEHITSSDLAEQTRVILGAIDGRFNKVDNRLDDLTKELYAVRSELKTEIRAVKDELEVDINNVQTLIDGYVKAQEDFKQEFVIMKEEVRMMKQIFKEKLGVEIRAF